MGDSILSAEARLVYIQMRIKVTKKNRTSLKCRLVGGCTSCIRWGLPEHRMSHTLLVLKNSLLLAKNRKVNLDVVALSAILHDIAAFSSERKKHAEEGAKIAEEYLKKHRYPDYLVQKVVHSIRVHSGPSAPSPRSDEAKILQDTDTID